MLCLEATDRGGKRTATTKAGKASIIQSLSSGARLVISLFSGSGPRKVSLYGYKLDLITMLRNME